MLTHRRVDCLTSPPIKSTEKVGSLIDGTQASPTLKPLPESDTHRVGWADLPKVSLSANHNPRLLETEIPITVQDAQDLVGVASVLYMVTPDDEWARRGHLYCEGSHVFSENFGFRRGSTCTPDGITAH
ncbi:hypothetical protein DPEC_G00068390 [Dallia pectoralis]|uniref:Uncharacterized protein n=1 Tax=Dallia pectoralis TaxID=75939 RepID=A0ACC2H1N3_DALPE|nr:hypothetical protein DPEC_G00068390 [Dallia pectoralis]